MVSLAAWLGLINAYQFRDKAHEYGHGDSKYRFEQAEQGIRPRLLRVPEHDDPAYISGQSGGIV